MCRGGGSRAQGPVRAGVVRKLSQVKLPLPTYYREDCALRPQAAGGVGVCASVPLLLHRCSAAGWAEAVHGTFRSHVSYLVAIFCRRAGVKGSSGQVGYCSLLEAK